MLQIPVRRRVRAQAGFTLLEMLVVLVIIGLLAGLVGPQLLGRMDRSKTTAADMQVRMLYNALDTMRLDIGRYPTDQEGLDLLVATPADQRLRPLWHGPYLSEAVPKDPWGSPYQYRRVSDAEAQIFSLGPDGKTLPPRETRNTDAATKRRS
jgi:general secretion pathway protein G